MIVIPINRTVGIKATPQKINEAISTFERVAPFRLSKFGTTVTGNRMNTKANMKLNGTFFIARRFR